MIKLENECVGCTNIGLPCQGSDCPNREVARHYCDDCGESGELYELDDMELCRDCVFNYLEKVEW